MGRKLPNILLIVTDQLRSDCVGCYHGYPVKTPHLDFLAKSGMVFEQAYTPQPLCCPARQSMISSRRPERNGGLWNYSIGLHTGYLKSSPEFWTNQLKAMGYHNYYFGKWHVSPEEAPTSFGYDKYVDHNMYKTYYQSTFGKLYSEGDRCEAPEHPYSKWLGETDTVPLEYARTHWLAKHATDQLEECSKQEGPWHIRLDFLEPHLPCRPCKEFLELYDEDKIPEWEGFRETFIQKPYIQHQQIYNWGLESMGWEEWRKIVARYYAIISQVDDAIGRVIQKLKETGQWENTLIIFTSDHGDMCGSHGMMDKNYVFYDDVVHVPFIVTWPGKIAAGSRNDEFIYQALDLGPTIMEVTGRTLENTDGRSLLPLLRGEKPTDWRQEIMSTFNGQQFGLYSQRMLRTKKWKYVWNNMDIDELYHLEDDKGELHNLVHEPDCQDLLKDFRKRLYEILLQEGDGIVSMEWMRNQLLGKTSKL